MVWEALTNPNITEQYWGNTRLESDWKVGSKLLFRRGKQITDEQTLLRIEPPKFLSYSFNPLFGEFAGEQPSRVTFELTSGNDVVKLVVTHDCFQFNSEVYLACLEGWPMIISSLKSLLECGQPLPDF